MHHESPLDQLRHHVTGAIERGEATPILGIDSAPLCDSCNDRHISVTDRENGNAECDLCWADSLSHGHSHGLHVDLVADCPFCVNRKVGG